MPFPSINIGGFADIPLFGKTGFKAKFSGGFDLGVGGYFEAKGGAVAVDYQTDITVSAQRKSVDGGPIIAISDDPLDFGEHFIVRASQSPDPEFIAMRTDFASIKAGLNLNYGLEVHASLKGKIGGDTVFNEGFDKSIHDSVPLIHAELNPGTGVGELLLLGGEGNTPFGKTYGLNPDNPSLDVSAALGILNASLYVPTLNTGLPDCTGDPVPDPCDNFNDSRVSGTAIFNSQLPVDRSHGQTRIDFFRLGIGLDNIVSAITKVPLNFEVGNSTVKLDVTLINADVEAYLRIAQRMTFDSNLMVDYSFTIDQEPVWVAVETSPGSRIFESVTTRRVPIGQDLEIIHPSGTLEIDVDYVLGGRFRNDTDVYLSNALDLTIGEVELTGSLIETAQDFDVLPDDLSFCLYCPGHIELGPPIPIIGLFDNTFDMQGFEKVDSQQSLSLDSEPPTTFTVLALADDPTITEGVPLNVSGTIYDPDRAADGSEIYELTIDWKDGSAHEQVILDNDPLTPLPSHVNFDPLSGVFTVTHVYVDEGISRGNPALHKDVALTVKRLTPLHEVIGEPISTQIRVEILNAAATISLDPLFLNNDGDATLTGSYRDLGLLDVIDVTVVWSARESGSPFSKFFLPATSRIAPGDTFPSDALVSITPALLTVNSVDLETGTVEFTITGYNYPAAFQGGTLTVTVHDNESLFYTENQQGRLSDSVPIPWGFDLQVPSFTSAIDENGLAEIEIRFTDDSNSLTLIPPPQDYELVVDWDDPNDPRQSTFHVVVGNILDLFGPDLFGIGTTFASSTDDAVLEVVNVDQEPVTYVTRSCGFNCVERLPKWNITPTFKLTRRYADDGDAAAGNWTRSDVSNVVINIFDGDFVGDAPRGGTVIKDIVVSNVAPTLTLDAPDEVGAGGLALLRGTISDPGTLDTFKLHVDWGDGSTFDNDNDASTTENPYQSFTFGSTHEFTVSGTFFDVGIDEGAGDDPTVFSLGAVNLGVAAPDAATGTGYIMYSVESVFNRFFVNPPYNRNSENLIAIRFDGTNWQYSNKSSDWHVFTPTAGDRLLATINFSADSITSLQGIRGNIDGINSGFLDGDLVFESDFRNAFVNDGEFTVPHIFTQDLDGGAYRVVVDVFDDDLGKGLAAVSFVVDFDLDPVAFDDFVSTNTNHVLVIDVLADNDLDGTSADPDPAEDVDHRGNRSQVGQ